MNKRFDVEAKSRTDTGNVLSVDPLQNGGFTRIVEPTGEIGSLFQPGFFPYERGEGVHLAASLHRWSSHRRKIAKPNRIKKALDDYKQICRQKTKGRRESVSTTTTTTGTFQYFIFGTRSPPDDFLVFDVSVVSRDNIGTPAPTNPLAPAQSTGADVPDEVEVKSDQKGVGRLQADMPPKNKGKKGKRIDDDDDYWYVLALHLWHTISSRPFSRI
ncbi:hypothetical protein EDD15DRAFT_2290447 [Pisolithus albus]|nr:hypothetical protein EDD15DRAFT_2290447 [Pisolithus albus]